MPDEVFNLESGPVKKSELEAIMGALGTCGFPKNPTFLFQDVMFKITSASANGGFYLEMEGFLSKPIFFAIIRPRWKWSKHAVC